MSLAFRQSDTVCRRAVSGASQYRLAHRPHWPWIADSTSVLGYPSLPNGSRNSVNGGDRGRSPTYVFGQRQVQNFLGIFWGLFWGRVLFESILSLVALFLFLRCRSRLRFVRPWWSVSGSSRTLPSTFVAQTALGSKASAPSASTTTREFDSHCFPHLYPRNVQWVGAFSTNKDNLSVFPRSLYLTSSHIFRFITFGGRSAHLAYHVHRSGRKVPPKQPYGETSTRVHPTLLHSLIRVA